MAPTLDGYELVTRHLVMEKDLNPAGNLFGGTVLAWLDEATGIFVSRKIGYTNFVTAAMNDVSFHAPGHRGDIIVVYSRIVRTGNSSLTASTKAFVEEPVTGVRREMITCTITFVCMKDQKPYPYFRSAAYAAWTETQESGG